MGGSNMMCQRFFLAHALALGVICFAAHSVAQTMVPAWHGTGPRDLHREYNNIFKHGNRNAASHLWYSFVNERAPQMTHDRFEVGYLILLFYIPSGRGVCARALSRVRHC